MTSKFSSRLVAMVALGAVAATLLAACSGASASSSGGKLAPNASFKLGVSLTFNNTDFWTNYISYEKKFAQQYNAQLLGPLIANNDAQKQIEDIHTLIQEGAQALIVNLWTARQLHPHSISPPASTFRWSVWMSRPVRVRSL
jgi:ribose transport system substrate-binding protein